MLQRMQQQLQQGSLWTSSTHSQPQTNSRRAWWPSTGSEDTLHCWCGGTAHVPLAAWTPWWSTTAGMAVQRVLCPCAMVCMRHQRLTCSACAHESHVPAAQAFRCAPAAATWTATMSTSWTPLRKLQR